MTATRLATDEVKITFVDDVVVLAQDCDLIFVERATIPALIEKLRNIWRDTVVVDAKPEEPR